MYRKVWKFDLIWEKKTIALWKQLLTIIWKNYGTISKAMVL